MFKDRPPTYTESKYAINYEGIYKELKENEINYAQEYKVPLNFV